MIKKKLSNFNSYIAIWAKNCTEKASYIYIFRRIIVIAYLTARCRAAKATQNPPSQRSRRSTAVGCCTAASTVRTARPGATESTLLASSHGLTEAAGIRKNLSKF